MCGLLDTFRVVVDHSSEVLDPKMDIIVVLWRKVCLAVPMHLVHLVQHGNVRTLNVLHIVYR